MKKSTEVEIPFNSKVVILAVPCFAQNNQIPYFFREQNSASSKEKCVQQWPVNVFNVCKNL